MPEFTQNVIVQNGLQTDNITQATIEMSRWINGPARGTQPAFINPIYNGRVISATNPLPPLGQAEIEISNLRRRFRHAILKYRVAGGRELVVGPYVTLPGPLQNAPEQSSHRFMDQIRFAVQRPRHEYVQVQIEDVLQFNETVVVPAIDEGDGVGPVTAPGPAGWPDNSIGGEFEGSSNSHDYHEALDAAIAAAKNGLRSTLIEWRVVEVRGMDGGFTQVHLLVIKIAAWLPGDVE